MMLQLNPPLPVETPKGKAVAYMVVDYGPEFDLLWVCFNDDTGECWSWPNPKIRIQNNISFGRTHVEKPSSRGTSASDQAGTGPMGYSVGQSWTMTQQEMERITKVPAMSFRTGYSFTRSDTTTS